MKHRIIFATGNAGKMREIRLILGDLGCDILSMKEAGADPEIVENGKASVIMQRLKHGQSGNVQEILCWQMIRDWKWII